MENLQLNIEFELSDFGWTLIQSCGTLLLDVTQPEGARFTRETFMDLQVCSLSCMVSIKSGHIFLRRRLVTPKGGLVRESPFKSPKNSGLGIIVLCPDKI